MIPGELSDLQKIFVLLAEIRQCLNEDQPMAAQRKAKAIETILRGGAMIDPARLRAQMGEAT